MGTLLAVIVLVIYGGGIWRFWKGFRRTNFSPNLSNRLYLSLMWPVLIVVNKSYRRNFNRALKG